MSRDPSPATFEGGPLDPDDTGEDLSRWGYWVPFEPSIDAALDRLRHAVFNSGQYVLPGVLGFGPNFAELDAKWREENNITTFGDCPPPMTTFPHLRGNAPDSVFQS